jgi:hypothetical protein
MPAPTMADNKAASVILVCVKCRRKISGLTRALRNNQRCACGGEMEEEKRVAKETGK